MSDNTKRITITVRMLVSLTVDAAPSSDGAAEVVDVVSFNGLPSTSEVMEALDADGAFDQLDNEFPSED